MEHRAFRIFLAFVLLSACTSGESTDRTVDAGSCGPSTVAGDAPFVFPIRAASVFITEQDELVLVLDEAQKICSLNDERRVTFRLCDLFSRRHSVQSQPVDCSATPERSSSTVEGFGTDPIWGDLEITEVKDGCVLGSFSLTFLQEPQVLLNGDFAAVICPDVVESL